MATAVTPASCHVICIRTPHQWLQHLLVPPGRHKTHRGVGSALATWATDRGDHTYAVAAIEPCWTRGIRLTPDAVLGAPPVRTVVVEALLAPWVAQRGFRLRPGRCGRRLRGHRPRGGSPACSTSPPPRSVADELAGPAPTGAWPRRGPPTHDGSGVGRAGGRTPLGRLAGWVGQFFCDRLRSVPAAGVYSGTATCRGIGFG